MDSVYAVIFIDAINVKIREGQVTHRPVYLALGVTVDGARALIAELVANARSFIAETDAVRRAIEPSGDVNDNASPALRDIRDALRRQRAKLRSTLEGLTRGRDTAKYLQDQIITDRNGRYVIVVRAEHRDAIPGIVHGASASGASLYLEPMSTVVAEQRHRRARRAREGGDPPHPARADRRVPRARRRLDALLDAAADLDELHAKARLARRVDGIAPELTDRRPPRVPRRAPSAADSRGARPARTDRTDGLAGPSGPGRQSSRPICSSRRRRARW